MVVDSSIFSFSVSLPSAIVATDLNEEIEVGPCECNGLSVGVFKNEDMEVPESDGKRRSSFSILEMEDPNLAELVVEDIDEPIPEKMELLGEIEEPLEGWCNSKIEGLNCVPTDEFIDEFREK